MAFAYFQYTRLGVQIRGTPARKGTEVNFGMWGGRSKKMYPPKYL